MTWRIVFGLIVVLTLVGGGWAQEAPVVVQPYELPEMAVTAQKTPQPVQEITQRHDIIISEQIEQIPL